MPLLWNLLNCVEGFLFVGMLVIGVRYIVHVVGETYTIDSILDSCDPRYGMTAAKGLSLGWMLGGRGGVIK